MKIELSGYNIDNLIKILYSKKITLLNIERSAYNKISFEILDKDHKKVKRYIANFKVKETLSKFKQIPQFLLNNLGVILGCFVGVLFGIFASNYTWQIQVYGTKELSKNDIILVLNEHGIRKGKINHQTSEEIEEILLNKYSRIAQVSVIREGTAIIINLSEKLVYVEGEFQPIKAKYSGIIKEINIITGTTNVKVGDYVNAGDILVLPFNINANGEKVGVMPLAEIKAEMFIIEKSEIKKTETKLVRTGRTATIYNYKFKNKKIFSSKNKNSFALFEMVVYNENVSDLLPLNRDKIVYFELTQIEVENDFEQEKENFVKENKEKAHLNLPVGEILSENTETSIYNDKMFAITTISIYGIIT